ncbi:putative cytochrome c peroxidase [Phaeomoniella chlamydospora]|uniref:Peroxidase n=1 Tax=Phaeomoniella chlamydospora TaxID=158046 RepID=A0A0G2ESM1_PHACM|nr:putative cytochrome c peroxidase [Phaeomoniella chlamydospora]
MATASRTFSRAFARSSTHSIRLSARQARPTLAQQSFQSGRRGYASGAGAGASGSSKGLWIGLTAAAAAAGAGGYLYFSDDFNLKKGSSGETKGIFTPTKDDYQNVYNYIAELLVENDDYDDGSYGPVLVRLAWHASGTYDAATGTGGSNGATMRFAPESDHGANAGLKHARDFLEPVKEKFPWISYSDLWTLAGVCAIQEMQGPIIPWRPGRNDRDVSFCTPDGRLPDAAQGSDHIRAIFSRMGFDDREMVALSGAHALGRCHPDRSGFDGPWDFSPTVMTNEYFKLLMNEKWNWRKWNGPKQYQDSSKTLMMLPTDIALIKDPIFKQHVKRYAADSQVFFNEFSDVIVKLLELGVPFTQEERFAFTPSTEQ